MKNILAWLLTCFIWPVAAFGNADSNSNSLVFYGMSDASAGVSLGPDKFIAADDEENILKVYKIQNGSKPVFNLDMSRFLETLPDYPEADIEAAAKIGSRIYWITSHGRNRDGRPRPNRHRFFATEIVTDSNGSGIRPVGKPYKNLTSDLVRTKSDVQADLVKASGSGFELKGKDYARLAPKNEGLNIEGLCASPDGNTLYIGFRNPLHRSRDGKEYAIIIPLKNPAAVVDKGQQPVFGSPLLWDLDGRGVRDMAYSPFHKACFIIAGPSDEKAKFALYRWSGQEDKQPVLVRKIETGLVRFTPEAILVFDNSDKLLLLSDDGALEVEVSNPAESKEPLIDDRWSFNKSLANPGRKTFRAAWIKP
jgi:hypothetical protein